MWTLLAVIIVAVSAFVITPSEAHHKNKCPPNEVFDYCPNPCPPQKCGVNKALILCPPPPKQGSPNCKPGCRCVDGFLRNKDGICIPEYQCPHKCPKNETLDYCYSPCPRRECGVNIAAISCVPVTDCKPACRCCDGYLRNAQGFCIREEDCPVCKNPNEVYDVCPAPCPPRRCDVDERSIRCPAPPKLGDPECKAGCRCADGFVRNHEGKCVTRDQCPSCGGDPHAVAGCGVNCGRLCSDLHKKEPVACIDICYENACDCRDGFYYDLNQHKCVLPDHCTPTCDKNEVYSDCIQGQCQPKRCSDLGYPVACPRIDPKYCKKGCLCKQDFVRAANGTCIPKDKCPSCGGDPNAVSGCGVNCGRHCSDYNKDPVACPAICNINGCDCRKGYVQDDNTRKCILPKDCAPTCGKHEVYSDCIQGQCQPKSCSDLGYPIACPRIDPKYCKKGCLCKQDFVRAANGTCIPKDKCPSCGGDPNAESGCGVNCGRHCSDYNKGPVACPAICNINGCDCRKGYVQDDNTRKCILPKDCVSCRGDHNAQPGCDEDCSQRCPGPRPDKCKCYKNSCKCKDGYLFDPTNNKCVRPDQCAPVCGQNEVFSDCVNGGCSAKNCSQLGQPVPCVKPLKCKTGCLCKDGYLRDDKGVCVPKDKCPPTCGHNEVLSNCSNGGCGPWTCDDVGFPTGCVKIDPKYCKVGCICKQGYVRDDYENCIPVTDCPSCGGDANATAGCGINCGRLCSNYNKGPVACVAVCLDNACDCKKPYVFDEEINKCVLPEDCTPVCGQNEVFSDCVNGGCYPKSCSQLGQSFPCVEPPKCQKGCLCKDGYLRDDNGICVPKDKCPPKCLKPNEIYDPCPPICPPQTCESIGKRYSCPAIPVNKTSNYCKGTCRCKKGYFRNKIGECISEKDCLQCTGPNEYFTCGGACDNVCSTLKVQNQTNCPIVNIQCNSMCYCEANYARDANNTCIPIEQCPESQCGDNERYEQCPDRLCVPQSCKDLGFPIKCPDLAEDAPCPGPPKCICEFNYVRNKDGKCIPKDQCPSCGGDPNAKSGCGLNCGRLCSNYNHKGPIPCPRICLPNSCDCKDDYVFDGNIKKCVRPKDCTPVCKNNEVFSDCINGGCQPKNCSQLGTPVPCVKLDPKYCIKGCLCEEGYLRAKNGTCVPKDQCDTSCGGDPNAIPGCGVNCGRHCSNYKRKDVVCAAVCKDNGCDCKKGYVFDDNTKKCVEPKDCTPVCRKNEVWDTCANGGCSKRNCSQLGQPDICIDVIKCIGGCVCQEGYLRAKNGTCIPQKECPTKCTGPNEYFACGGACDNVCETLSKQNQTHCPIINIKCNPMCYCAKGYARDKNNICIPIDQCPKPKCAVNERLDPCPDSLCTPQTCDQLGFPITCPAFSGDTNSTCPGKPGCVCDNDMVRNKYGKCIPKDKCPSCGGDPNAQSGCGVNCGRLCSNYNKKGVACPLVCNTNGCDCKKGFVLDSNIGKCVLPEKCTPVCGANEVWDTCANGGCGRRNCSQLGQPILCIDPIKCIGGCVCRKGYLLTQDGKCVPEDQCPQLQCGPDERYEENPSNICEPLYCSDLGFPMDCCSEDNPDCESTPACICKPGLVRDEHGKCIPKSDCPSCGGDPNAVAGCGINCGKHCSDYGKPVSCILVCYDNACDCRDDFYYDKVAKKCVPLEDCCE